MNRSLASTAVQTQSNSLLATLNLLQPKAAKVGLDLTDDQTASNTQPATPLLALVDEARVLLGWSQKQMALNAAVNFGTWSDAINGKPGKNFALAWLDKQPIEYRIAYAKLVSKKFAISKETERAIVLRRLFDCIEELLVLTVVSE